MRKIILSQPHCGRCKSLSLQVPDAEVVELDQPTLLALARALDVRILPMVVLASESIEELAERINDTTN